MKFILLFTLIISVSSNAQDLTFKDLEYVLKNNSEMISTYLTKKGFEFFKYDEATSENDCSTTQWAKNRNSINNFAYSFIAKFCELPMDGFVWYQPPNIETYNFIKSECKKNGFIFKKREFEKEVNAMNYVYENNKYRIAFAEGINDKNNNNAYSITLKSIRK
jgi:hypothetical protein